MYSNCKKFFSLLINIFLFYLTIYLNYILSNNICSFINKDFYYSISIIGFGLGIELIIICFSIEILIIKLFSKLHCLFFSNSI